MTQKSRLFLGRAWNSETGAAVKNRYGFIEIRFYSPFSTAVSHNHFSRDNGKCFFLLFPLIAHHSTRAIALNRLVCEIIKKQHSRSYQ